MGKDVVAKDQVGADALLHHRLRLLFAEEGHARGDAFLQCGFGHIRGRLYTEARNPSLHKPLEEVAIVRGELHDLAAFIQPQSLRDHVHVPPRVLQPRRGVRREVGVLGEDDVGLDVFVELDEVAGFADKSVERIEDFALVQILGLHDVLARRAAAEIHEGVAQRRIAEAAREAGDLGGGRKGGCLGFTELHCLFVE